MNVCPLGVLSGRGLCDKLITQSEESSPSCVCACVCVCVCVSDRDPKTPIMRSPWPALCHSTTGKEKKIHHNKESWISTSSTGIQSVP
jgi:hypothetical protein